MNKVWTILGFLWFPYSVLAQSKVSIQPPLKLSYNEPARFFEESLVLGNGIQGATVFGGITTDKIYLNDLTLWSGGPVNSLMNPEAYKHLPEVREALQDKDYKKAERAIKQLQGKFSESYAPLGTLFLEMKGDSNLNQYYRELDLNKAIARVITHSGDNEITREYLVSRPDKIFLIHLISKKKSALSFTVRFTSLLRFQRKVEDQTMIMEGQAPVKADPSYMNHKGDAIKFDPKKGTRFTTRIKVITPDGRISQNDSSLTVSKATEATIYVSMATSFHGFDKDPITQGIDNTALSKVRLSKALDLGYQKIKIRHIQDYQALFNRVQLKLADQDTVNLPTDQRLKRYALGYKDPYLETLYFQFGRYLLISSSRTPGVPANLQGLWNPYLQPPWSSNYTLNINAEENYWLAENTNLSELHLPFLDFIGNLSKTGYITARTFYDMPGWVAHHNSDIWAMSNPVGDFGKGDPNWANWPMGGAWASTHLWEHYLFTQDKVFLREKAYPLMKGAAQFCLAWLVKDSLGQYITSPSTSPENIFKTPSGYQGSTLFGGTADLAMIRELFLDLLAAEKILKNDHGFAKKINLALKNLHPYQVGKKGNLQEWYFDWEDAEPQHRHQSHLFGLYPGTHITPENTPILAAAAKRTLEIKGDETTGWSKGWRINLWARLKDGDHAYKMYRELLKYVPPDGLHENYSNGGGTYPNLLDAHPPFQIDGNFGGAAAVAEMLVQSNSQYIELLPALPKAWPSGQVKGLKARGGYEINMTWKEGKVISLTLKSRNRKYAKVWMNGKMELVRTNPNSIKS